MNRLTFSYSFFLWRNIVKKWKSLILLSIILGLGFCLLNIKFLNIAYLPENFYVSYDEVDKANKENIFGRLVNVSLKEDLQTGDNKETGGEFVVKLFGFLPIKKVKVNILPEEEVYIGGMPIGLTIHSQGALVVSDSMIDNLSVIKNDRLQSGDIIKEIDGKSIESIDDIQDTVNSTKNDTVKILLQRGNKDKVFTLPILKDKDGENKLGIWVRNDLSGIGTLTFVKKENNQFAALGHAITSGKDNNVIPINSGEIYNCSLINVEKGIKNKPGELRCVFVQRDKKGEIEKNTNVGIYGKIENIEEIVDLNKKINLGGRLSVKPGKGKLISSISGISEEYDIEIIKANYQTKSSDKSLVIRVTDKKLLDLTGGIVQGMSGSPIVQNGKLVGAVTHVFVSDPTKGYGVYSDWMLEQLSA